MPEEPVSQTPVPETDQQQAQADEATERALGDMLGNIPGLDKYFGESSEQEKPAEPAKDASVEAPETEPASEESLPQEEEVAAKEEKEALPAGVQQRIDGLIAEKYRHKEKIEALEARIKEFEERASKPVPVPTPENPVGHIDNMETLNQRFQEAKQVKRWALENLDGGEIKNSAGEVQYLDGPAVKRWLALTDELLTDHIPQQAANLQNRAQFERQAKAYYPNLFKAGTEENATVAAWIKALPQITRYPDYQLIIADAIAGQKMRLAKAQSNNGAKSRTPTLAAPSPSSGSKVPQEKSVLSKELLERMVTDRSALDVFSESLIKRK